MRFALTATLAIWLLVTGPALGQQAAVLRDLESNSPITLTKADLHELMSNAKMSRIIANGNLHIWTNDPDGTFIVSSDSRATSGRPATGRGKWHISEDGRYCILIEWPRAGGAEDWCRLVIKTTDGYYTTRSVKSGTEKVYKIEVRK
jgi:hypothetical protein